MSESPTHPPAGVVPATAPADRSASSLAARLVSLERSVDRMAGILARQLPERLAETADRQRSRLAELAGELGAAFRKLMADQEGLRTGLSDDLARSEERVAELVAAAEERIAAAVSRTAEAVRERLGESEATLAGRLAEQGEALRERADRDVALLRDRLEEVLTGIRPLMDELATELSSELEAVREVPGRLAEGMDAVREAVAEIATAHAHIDRRLEVVADASTGEAARAKVEETSEALAERLGEAAGSMRWELQDTLARVQEQMSTLAGAVDAVRSDAERRAAALQDGLQRVDNLAEAVETIGRRRGFKQVVQSDERFREEQAAMVDRLGEAGERLSARLQELKAELEVVRRAGVEAQAGAVSEEVRRRVAEELVTEEMVKAVLERMAVTFERRFDELVSRVDARLDRAEAESRRGLFRRARERT